MVTISLQRTIAALLATSLSASAQTPSPQTTYIPPTTSSQIEKVTQPPALKLLALSTPSRVSISSGATPDYVTQWPGAYFNTAFQGTTLYFTVGVSREVLHLAIDNQPPLILATPQPGLYRVSGLSNSRHSATLYIATESASMPQHFGGFSIPVDERELPPARHSRQMEFIGDSFTVGYGNTSPQHDCNALPGGVYAATDDTQASGPLTAAHFHADYQVNAISGRGVVRNYHGNPGDLVPVAYPYLLLDKQQPYSDPNWHPQVIVVSLGTNDFTTGLKPDEKWKTREDLHADFEQTYMQFLQSLRAKNPNAYLIVWATNLARGEIATEGQHVVDKMKSSGEQKITFISFDQLTFTGCDSHPSVADDKTISSKMVEFIEAHPTIWQAR
ncbi:lysophospholipase L1-like esterase [Granulicella aggregans]|uniref:Lysophospholipase L1-like esterase n=1 Tax=Granulicella aggregans TaxID=474949 RepID=A0A7W7ZEB1_9BACT|nr:SGNH/GDSL hydrolase family protein [Granulicella aggregans]MBB5058168.1 lysophospholipase L1-like esterase [Granulicella aggregans]